MPHDPLMWSRPAPPPPEREWCPPYKPREPGEPLKVAFLTPGLLVGGAERWVASLCQNFDRRIIKPHVVLWSEWGSVSPIVYNWIPRDVQCASINQASMQANLCGSDVLISWGHTHLSEFTSGMTRPIVDVQHGTLGFGKVQHELAQAAIDAGAHLVAVGEACVENFPEEHRERVTVLENGAELGRVCPRNGRLRTRIDLRIHGNQKVVLFVGRFAEVKNLDGLARAVAALPEDWVLVAAGPHYSMPPELPALGDKVRILPAVDSPGDLFAAADVFCSPSHHEANSLAVLEAMAGGLPVVTTDYPAAVLLRQQHGDLATMVQVRPEPEDLAAAIMLAYAEGRESPRVRRAQRLVWEEYTAQAMTARWERYLWNKFGG